MDFASYISQKGAENLDFNPKNIHNIFNAIGDKFPQDFKSIHIVGTNGKGSTGRFLAQALMDAGYCVLHFSSPHIFDYGERFYGNFEAKFHNQNIDLRDIANWQNTSTTSRLLQAAHRLLQENSSVNEASFFEYSTLMILAISKLVKIDYLVCEAGLGGVLDATSILSHTLSLFSVIDFDHTARLGTTIKQIATTKLLAASPIMLLAPQCHLAVLQIAKDIAENKGYKLYACKLASDLKVGRYEISNDTKLQDFVFDYQDLKITKDSSFLEINKNVAINALELLSLPTGFLRDYRQQNFDLLGRNQLLKSNILLDVGHNINAAKALKESLKNLKKSQKISLIYNAYEDKDIRAILQTIKDEIDLVEILSYEHHRLIDKDKLEMILTSLSLPFRDFVGLEEGYFYVVFGSFSLVEHFLKGRYFE